MALPWYAKPNPTRPSWAKFPGSDERDKAMREYVQVLRTPPPATVPTRPTNTWRPTTTTARTTSSPSRTTSSSRSSGSSGSSRSSGGGKSAAQLQREAEARAKKLQDDRDKKAANKYQSAAERLIAQADKLKIALGKDGYKKRLTQQLKNVTLQFNEQDSLILDQYARGRRELERKEATTTDELSTATSSALTNLGRERAEAMQQVTLQGASGTDMLRAMGASLRNWQANQREVTGNYVDAMDALNSSEAEMVNMVRSQRQSAWRQREEQRSTLYNRYYDQLSQTYTDYGNKLGEAANMWGEAVESWSTDARKKAEKKAKTDSEKAFEQAAKMTGKSYTELPVSSGIKNWKGRGEFDTVVNPQQFARPELQLREGEGATLRRWRG